MLMTPLNGNPIFSESLLIINIICIKILKKLIAKEMMILTK